MKEGPRKCFAAVAILSGAAAADGMVIKANFDNWRKHRDAEAVTKLAAGPLSDAAWSVAPGVSDVKNHLGRPFPIGEKGRDNDRAVQKVDEVDQALAAHHLTKGKVNTVRLKESLSGQSAKDVLVAFDQEAGELEKVAAEWDSQGNNERNWVLGASSPFAAAGASGLLYSLYRGYRGINGYFERRREKKGKKERIGGKKNNQTSHSEAAIVAEGRSSAKRGIETQLFDIGARDEAAEVDRLVEKISKK